MLSENKNAESHRIKNKKVAEMRLANIILSAGY